MASADGYCADCIYRYYPAQYPESRRYAAVVVAAVDLFILYGGLLFVWLRRHEPLMWVANAKSRPTSLPRETFPCRSRRDWSLSVGLALTNLLW